MTLAEFWFWLIGFLFVGYFVLEGFDFGVGALLPVLGKDDTARRVMINTIGPVWDANETWLIVAGASLFAAFPFWYAAAFSGFYLPLFLILAALIVRGVAFEYRGKVDDPAWRERWDICIVIGSVIPPLIWGVAFANLVRGLPLDKDGNFTGSLFTLLNPFALLGGLVFLSVFLTHGSIFIALKTVGAIRHNARTLATRLGMVAVVLGAVFALWMGIGYGGVAGLLLAIVSVVALVGALIANGREDEGRAFALMVLSIAALVVAIFASLFPNVLPSTSDPAFTLTIDNASSTPNTLGIMTWIMVAAAPFVLAYQAWTYWVFRKRIGRRDIPAEAQHGAGTEIAP